MRYELICAAILSAMLGLAPHTHADDADKLRDLTAKAEKGDAAAQLSLAVRYRDDRTGLSEEITTIDARLALSEDIYKVRRWLGE